MVADEGPPDVAGRYQRVRDNIARAAERVGRDPWAVNLIVVTKGVPPGRVEEAIRAGARHMGENRLQEALPKIQALVERHEDLHWHFIGTLQRRKVKSVIGLFEVIQSVDGLPLAEEINRRAAALSEDVEFSQRVCLEVNLGQEPTKAGFDPAELAGMLPALDALRYLKVEGLMAIPPYTEDPEGARPYFRQLRELAQSLRAVPCRRVALQELSMGMSHDYEIAVEEGATMVRVGQAIFGARDA